MSVTGDTSDSRNCGLISPIIVRGLATAAFTTLPRDTSSSCKTRAGIAKNSALRITASEYQGVFTNVGCRSGREVQVEFPETDCKEASRRNLVGPYSW